MCDKKRAFTVVELVVVIAVLAILTAILVPVLGDIINRANDSVGTQSRRNEEIQALIDDISGDSSASPSITEAPTESPTEAPTEAPTEVPTEAPTEAPTPSYYTRSGDYIYFGSYPQSEVTEGNLKAKLKKEAGTSGWTSYSYYSGSKESSYMTYRDIVYEGTKYRGVYFTQYRPTSTELASSDKNSNQDEHKYSKNSIYWFKYEPVKWKIVSESGNDVLLVSDMILDAMDYNLTRDNSYEKSHIRKWLNDTFLSSAFTAEEQSLINTAAAEGINDKVFLLSVNEYNSFFSADAQGGGNPGVKHLTAYSKIQGARYIKGSPDICPWWLRTAFSLNEDEASLELLQILGVVFDTILNNPQAKYVTSSGEIYALGDPVIDTDLGVVPALHLNIG